MSQKSVNEGHGAELIAAAAAIASTTVGAAHADAVRFENDGGFFNVIDFTKPADQQVYGSYMDVTGSSIYIDYFGDFYPAFSYQHTYLSGSGAELLCDGFAAAYAAPQAFGTMIGAANSGNWNAGANFEFAFTACDYPYFYDCYNGYRGILPQGVPTYIGARLDINGQTHYGWLGVELSFGTVEVFAWGYETEANTAIGAGVPAPGALGVLAVGAVGALSRKKRA